ncbi:MAG: histidine kinase [Methylotenera sp.]|nr:histidine kinase [Methylotenera sp.]
MKVATSIVLGREAKPELAAEAVTNAMRKAGITVANSVLLLLTSEFASNPQAAIKAAASAASCTQVMGCSATGIFTEDDWVLDAPAAAAMVFGDDVGLQLARQNHTRQPLLTLSAPNAINSTWLNNDIARFGGVSGDAIGQGPFSVWQNAKGEVAGYVEAFFSGVNIVTEASHGLLQLTQPKKIQQVDEFDILLLDRHTSPFSSLKKAWKAHSKSNEPVPLHLVMAIYAESAKAIKQGEYNQTTVISYDETNGNIMLAQPLKPGQYISWGLRDTTAAIADMTHMTHRLTEKLGCQPDFALLFSCLGRGPYFYAGTDQDLKVITQQFPRMPLLGFYGNGEIASINGINQLLPYSAVLSLFSAKTD